MSIIYNVLIPIAIELQWSHLVTNLAPFFMAQVLARNLRPPHGQLFAVHGQTHLAATGDSKPGSHDMPRLVPRIPTHLQLVVVISCHFYTSLGLVFGKKLQPELSIVFFRVKWLPPVTSSS